MKSLLKPMLLALTLLAGAGSAKADGEVWIKTLPDDLKKGDKVVIVDLTTKMALANNCAEDAAPPSASIKLNDRNDRIAEETVGDTVRWTVGVEGSGDKRKLQFKTDDNRYLNALNKDNGLRIGGDGVKNFSTVYDEGNHRAWFLYTVVNDTARVMGMYSMLGIMNNWRIKTTIDDQIKGTVLAFFRKSDPSKSDVILSFVNADGEEDYNYETDLKNGANNFKAPTLNGLPSGAKVTYISTNEHVATVNASTGAITLLRRGTTDITVVYKGDSKNNYALATYTLRVDDGNETSGTSDHPFTVAEAIQYAKDGHGSAGYNYFVKGIVCKVESSNKGAYGGVSIPGLTDNSVEGTLTYWLSDSGVMKDSLKVSTGRGLNWSDLTTDSIAVGDEVLVVGPMSYSTGSNMMGMGTGTGTGTGTGGGKSKNGPVAVIDADNCMQSLFRKLLVDDTKLYLGTHRDGTELYRINGDVPGILGETTMSVKDTTVAKVTDDGWLVTQGVGKTVVTLNVPVTVPEGTYTMTRSFHLKVLAPGTVEGHFVLVEDASTLHAGDSLLVVGTINDKSYVISSNDATLGGKKAIEVRIGENGTIDEVPDDATSVTLRGTAGAWNLNTRRNYYFYTSSKKPGAKSLSIPGMGEGTGTGTGTGTETDTEEDSEEGSGGTMPDFMSLFNGTGANKLRHDSIPGEVGDSAQVKIAINADALATITFRGDSILRYTEEVDLAGLLGGLGSFGGSDDSGSSTSSFDPSVLEGLNISMPGFEVFSPDTVPGVLPKLYRFEQTEGETRYDYYVAELNENDNVLTFKGTNTAPDGVTTWDAINTPDDTYPAWLRNSSGRPRRFYTVVFDETFVAARPKCCRRWFNSSQIKSYVGLQNLNTSEVTNMYGMFMNNNHLSGALDLGHFKTSKVTNMEAMFYNCGELRTIYVGNGWDISNVTQSEDIFYASRSLVGQYGATYGNEHGISRANFDQPDGLLCFNGLIIKDDEDNSEALERYNGQTVNVYYDRVLRADKNEDGTWNSHAYSVCLPFDLDLTELRDADKVQTCLLYYIKDNKEFLFSNCSPKLKAGLGYMIVAKEGSVRLGADNVTVTNQLYEGGVPIYPYEDANAEAVGTWMGTLKKIESADAAAMYGFGLWLSGGTPYYMRVRPDTPNAWLHQFRAIYVPNEPTDIRYYTLSYKQWVAGGEDDPIVDFPSGDFDADEFPGTVGVDTPILSIDSDTHRYFDLQGRHLSAPAAKGVYIDNGKKVIK